MSFSKTNPFFLFLVIYLIPVIQLLGQFGIQVGNFLIGFFPSAILYYAWLLSILISLENRITPQIQRKVNIKFAIKAISICGLLIIPYNWVYSNLLFRGVAPFWMIILGGFSFFILLMFTIQGWITISKCIILSEKKWNDGIKTDGYWEKMLLFLFGPLTFFYLNRKISKALDLK